MNYANIKDFDIANGPGIRISLFVSGCTHHCKGCFNKEAWDFDYGQPFTQETIEQIIQMLKPAYVKGLTLLGGEPFEPQNQGAIVELLRRVKAEYPQKSIWAFSGYLFDKDLDVLVDGPFIEDMKDLMLRFRGSSNQCLIDVPKSLACGNVVEWEDWQGYGRGMK